MVFLMVSVMMLFDLVRARLSQLPGTHGDADTWSSMTCGDVSICAYYRPHGVFFELLTGDDGYIVRSDFRLYCDPEFWGRFDRFCDAYLAAIEGFPLC